MKKLAMLLTAIGALCIAACSQDVIPELHKDYLNDKGWEIKASSDIETYTLHISDDMLRNYEASKITFLAEHVGQTVTQYSYELTEQDTEGRYLKAEIVEVNGEIVGGYGVLPSWSPGVFHLDDKARLIDESMMK